MHDAESGLRSAEYVGDESRLREARQAYASALHELGQVLRDLDRAGMRAPQMPEEWIEKMDALRIPYTKFATMMELKNFVDWAGGKTVYAPAPDAAQSEGES
jgi:hypothetical protein